MASTEKVTRPVAAVITHDNLPGLRSLVLALLEQTGKAGIELVVVANAPPAATRAWLEEQAGQFSRSTLPDNHGPGAARNAVLESRPNADVYFFFDDDATLEGGEVSALSSFFEANPEIGLTSGLPMTEGGEPLVKSFTRRPLSRAFPSLWDRWWAPITEPLDENLIEADIIGAGSIAVRGDAIRAVGRFDPIFWPGCHEDTDFCARLRFAGYRIVVDRRLRIRQTVSTTMSRVFGSRHQIVCRATGVLFAALDYPLPIALARITEAALRSVLGPREVRRGDAEGLLRCAHAWRDIIVGRRERRRLRRIRAKRPSPRPG